MEIMVSRKPQVDLAFFGGTPVRRDPFPAWPDYGDEEITAAVNVLKSGKLARQSGSQVSQFESDFAEKFGVKHALAGVLGGGPAMIDHDNV